MRELFKLENCVKPSSQRDSYYRGFYHIHQKTTYVRVLPNQDSSLLNTLSKSNCLIKLPKDNIAKTKGSNVEILVLPHLY